MKIFTPGGPGQPLELGELRRHWRRSRRRRRHDRTTCDPCARASLSAIASALSVLGLVFGISNTAVTPPSTAARLPLSRSSLASSPGLAEMDLAVDHARQHVEPGAVDRLAGIADIADRDDAAAGHADIDIGRSAGQMHAPAFELEIDASHFALFLSASPGSYLFAMNETSPGTWLSDRALLRVGGEDVRGFLQGLVTQDVAEVKPGAPQMGRPAHAAGQGAVRFHPLGRMTTRYLIDCEADQRDALARRLTLYRLRRPITIESVEGAFIGRPKAPTASPIRAFPSSADAGSVPRPGNRRQAGWRIVCASA